MNNNGLPNEFTACETYRGVVIAISGGWYSAFRDGKKMGFGAQTRAALRKKLDEAFPLEAF